MRFLYIPIILLLFLQCDPIGRYKYNNIGVKPVYADGDSIYEIQNIPVQPISNSGSIYTWNHYLLIGELNKGIHVIDRTDPANPIKLTFIEIIGNKNFSISDSTLYADNGRDLITVDISDILSVSVLHILKNSIITENEFPPNYTGFFECPDKTKGIIVRWDSTVSDNLNCYR